MYYDFQDRGVYPGWILYFKKLRNNRAFPLMMDFESLEIVTRKIICKFFTSQRSLYLIIYFYLDWANLPMGGGRETDTDTNI